MHICFRVSGTGPYSTFTSGERCLFKIILKVKNNIFSEWYIYISYKYYRVISIRLIFVWWLPNAKCKLEEIFSNLNTSKNQKIPDDNETVRAINRFSRTKIIVFHISRSLCSLKRFFFSYQVVMSELISTN